CNARAWICAEVEQRTVYEASAVAFVTGGDGPAEPVAAEAIEGREPDGWYEPFDPAATLDFTVERNAISIHTWGDGECCLPAGAPRAALRLGRLGGEPWQHPLEPGDVLVFEEIKDPVYGERAGADRSHRQAV